VTVFPPAPLLWQNNLALDFTHSQIAYVGYEGTIFHISGPFAPVLGAQSGVVIQKIAHLDAGFKHLDNKGARQDGTTWYDTIYDPAEITMTIKLGGVSASDMRHVIASWFGAWDARQVGQLCWFSPERGEWVANVRLAKPLMDTFERDWYESQEVTMTWIARCDNAFWQGPDSVCPFANNADDMFDTFPYAGVSTLDSNWNQTTSPGGSGTVTTWIYNGAAWAPTGTTTGSAICQWVGHNDSLTDDQYITVTLADNMTAPVGSDQAYIDVWGRQNQSGTQGNYGVRARFGYSTYQLSIFNNGTEHDIASGSLASTPQAGDTLSLQCGVMNSSVQQDLGTILSGSIITGVEDLFQLFTGQSNGSGTWNPGQYQLYHNGVPLIGGRQILFGLFTVYWGTGFGYNDATYSTYGPGYRSAGFGMSAGGTGSGQVVPAMLSQFNAGFATGDISLTNIGDQPAWPRYLCYGPGVFLIEDVGTGNMITFGPLNAGQVALLNTMPRLPPVVDLSPAQNAASTNAPTGLLATLQTDAKNFLQTLINFATNNNVPPLLQKFESLFGITPPQGPLASYLSGRFTQPIVGMQEQVGATTTNIKCQIQGGSDQSQVIAALTPYRRWPE
jgi:hypothetical protein